MTRREEILEQAYSLPALPASAVQVAQLLQDPDADIELLTRAIELDPGLSANVLRLANSALLGGGRSTETVRAAIMQLGFQTIHRIAIASTVGPVASVEIHGYDIGPGQLWRHSVAVALCSEIVVSVLGLPEQRSAFTTGLLHDIGRIVLATLEDNEADRVVQMAFEKGLSFEVAERAVLGIDHGELGALLLESWGLPRFLADVVRCHHDPSKMATDPLLADVVHVADQLCTMTGIGAGRDGLNYRLCQDSAERLGLTPESADRILARTLAEFERLGEVLGVEAEE